MKLHISPYFAKVAAFSLALIACSPVIQTTDLSSYTHQATWHQTMMARLNADPESIDELWPLLKRDFKDDLSTLQIIWERQDNLWKNYHSGDAINTIASRYAQASNQSLPLTQLAIKLAENASTDTDLQLVRSAYYLSKQLSRIEYISVNYAPDEARIVDYRTQFNTVQQTFADIISQNLGGTLSVDALPSYYSELETLLTTLPLKLPAGSNAALPFGAYQSKLKYYPEWDASWRVGDYSDVEVKFSNGGHRLVFWRGTNYIPHWVTDNGLWYTNSFMESWAPGVAGSFEPMSDKQCRFSHVRVVEQSPARVVVHWRYALNDVNYNIAAPDAFTGWGDWVDEYYIIYPDAMGVRYVTCYSTQWWETTGRTTDDAGHEWQEGIVLYNAFEPPEKSLELDAVHVANMAGEVGKWSWETHGRPTSPTPPNTNIVLMNLKSDLKPFIISPEGSTVSPYPGSQGGSHFRWRDHWPTTMEPAPGRNASGKQASHGSFYHLKAIPIYERTPDRISKVLFHGITEKPASELNFVAKSWLSPPDALLDDQSSTAYSALEYDRSQRTYITTCSNVGSPGQLKMQLAATSDSPLLNPAVIIRNWGDRIPTVSINGKSFTRGSGLKFGHITGAQGYDLVIWLEIEAVSNTTVTISPSNERI